MSSSRFLSPLYLLSFSLLLQLAASYDMMYRCEGTNLPPNDPYNQSLNNLLSYLDSKTPLSGFGSGSLGQNVNQVYGLALCRGDLNTTECQTCVDVASNEIEVFCPYTIALIYYDECELKYSDTNFLGQVDNQHWSYFVGPANASDPVYFNEKVIALMNNLSVKAYASPKLYADGELGIGNSTNIYGLVQCTGDLSPTDCDSCLTQAIDWIPQYLYGKNGGKLVGGSCNVRFETYPFFFNA